MCQGSQPGLFLDWLVCVGVCVRACVLAGEMGWGITARGWNPKIYNMRGTNLLIWIRALGFVSTYIDN